MALSVLVCLSFNVPPISASAGLVTGLESVFMFDSGEKGVLAPLDRGDVPGEAANDNPWAWYYRHRIKNIYSYLQNVKFSRIV